MTHTSIINLNNIKNSINSIKKDLPEIIAVSKTFQLKDINHLIDYGHIHYGENKVQEASAKWTEIKNLNKDIKLHMIGKLQANKVKIAVKLFDFIHTIDSIKLAKRIAEEQKKINKIIKVFIQINIGNEPQKSGVIKDDIEELVLFCKNNNLNLLGLMCIPPAKVDPSIFFKETHQLNQDLGFKELSMGMSADYFEALKNKSTFIRIGSAIFGSRN